MLRRRFVVPILMLLAALGIGGVAYSQLETGDRGILPLDSSGTLEIGGIHVDVGGNDAMSARYGGWRVAQRQGFRALWAKMHNAPISAAPNLPDSTLDDIVTSINVEREQIGPNRYIADLGILFDRARAAPFLGVEGGEVRRSVPMLLIPITVTGGTATSVELKNAWQRAWAQFRTSQSAIDYVRVSGLGVDPMLVNAAQTERPAAAGGATSSTFMAQRTCSSPRSSCSGSIPAGRPRRRSSPATGRTMRWSAASPSKSRTAARSPR